MKFGAFAILVFALLTGCADQAKPDKIRLQQSSIPIQGRLTDSDRAQIVAVTQQIPNIEHEILAIKVQTTTRVEVQTGHVFAPLAGFGNIVTLKKKRGQWIVVGDPSMSVWNA